jgi:hypothetical protein
MLEIGNRVRLSELIRRQGIWSHAWDRVGTVWSVHTDGCVVVKWNNFKKLQKYRANALEKIPESEQT